MKKYIIILIAIFVLLFLMVISSIITIGDKVSVISPLLTYLFYIIISVLLFVVVIVPTLKMFKSPTMPDFHSADLDYYKAQKAVNSILKNCDLDEEERSNMLFELNSLGGQAVLQKFWNNRAKKIDKAIRENAISVFTLSAISQRGGIDMLICVTTNFMMINKLVKISGFRPTYVQLVKIYMNVFGASFIAMTSQELLDDIDFDFGILGVTGAVALKSILNGALNAYLTLRIGCATKEYIRLGGNFNLEEARARARKSARLSIKPMLLDLKDTVISAISKIGSQFV